MLFFRQLIIPGRQPLDKALDLQQRQRGQYAPGGQLRFVDHPVDRLLSALQLPQNGGFKPPPFPTWYQQQSGQFAPGQAMPAQGQPAPQFQYGPGQNALNYYSVPNGGTVRPDGYGGVQFGGFAPGDPKFTPAAYSGA